MDSITWFFVAVMLSVVAFLYWRQPSLIPGLATTMGVLGTFTGIFLGLLEFDTKDIPGSVPILLDGLKLAFITSIFGLGIAILYRIGQSLSPERKSEDATIDDLVNEIKSGFGITGEKLVGIESALTGDGESTLLTQIQKLRTSFNDKQDELVKEFRTFAETMTENNSKALIDALTQVMRDFNAKINEQFGENFKQLNEAVGRMLDWQEEYSNRIELMTQQFERTLKGVGQCEGALKDMVPHVESFRGAADGLREISDRLQVQNKELFDKLAAFSELASEAKEAFPVIRNNLENLTTGFSGAVNEAIESQSSAVESLKASLQAQSTGLQETQQQLDVDIRRMMSQLDGNLTNLMERNAETIVNQVQALDEQLGQELNNSLQTLGNQLASLSGKFVEDYTPLTDRLRELVQMARRAS